MNSSESSEEEEKQRFSGYNSRFDESIEVKNAEEIKSPINNRYLSNKMDDLEINSPENNPSFRRLSNDNSMGMMRIGRTMGSDPSDSDESDDDDIQGTNLKKQIKMYNPKEFDDLEVSGEVKELFQNIIRYTPQKIELNYKLSPYIPEFIPAVGDIDAFIKVPRPDGIADKVGLLVLDEPCANQSDPAVLHLQLRSKSKSADPRKQTVIKRIQDPDKNSKAIDKWIDDINQLHRSKHLPTVRLTNPMPDIDNLMQQWPSEIEEKLIQVQLNLSKLDCNLINLVEIVCNLLDIPVKPQTRIESLHTLFTLFLEVKHIKNVNY